MLPASAISGMALTAGVKRIQRPDAQGLLRIQLTPLGPGQKLRLPIPVRWIGAGKVRGLSITVYDADSPWRISSMPSRTVELSTRPEETWQ